MGRDKLDKHKIGKNAFQRPLWHLNLFRSDLIRGAKSITNKKSSYHNVEHGRVNGVFDDLLIQRKLDVPAGDDDRDDPQEAGEEDVEGRQQTKEPPDRAEREIRLMRHSSKSQRAKLEILKSTSSRALT